jgi:hypothetical protein
LTQTPTGSILEYQKADVLRFHIQAYDKARANLHVSVPLLLLLPHAGVCMSESS